jgi:SAM-dependent methyltransferase
MFDDLRIMPDYPDEALSLLKEIRRVLKPGGRVRIIVPDIEKCIMAYVNHDDDFFAGRAKIWTWSSESQTRLEDFLAYAGAGPRPSAILAAHKFGYDFETLQNLLRRADFTQIERSEYMKSNHPCLRVDHYSAVAGATYRDQHYSLFVEGS